MPRPRPCPTPSPHILLLLVLVLSLLLHTISTHAHPASRHVGRWSAPPKLCPSNTLFDCLLTGNGNIGAALGAAPGAITIYVGSNNFWTSNVAVDRATTGSGGSEYYTQSRVGWLDLQLPNLQPCAFAGTQELQPSRINATLTCGNGTTLAVSVIVTPDDRILATIHASSSSSWSSSTTTTRLSNAAITTALANASLTLHTGQGFQPAELPSAAGFAAKTSTAWATRRSVTDSNNAMVLAACGFAGQRNTSQLFVVNRTASPPSIGTLDGRCLRLDHARARVVVGACNFSAPGAPTEWRLVAPPHPPMPPPSPAYVPVHALIGEQPPPQTFRCQSASTCFEETAAVCTRQPNCSSFSLCACWASGQEAQLFPTGPDEGEHNLPWTTFVRAPPAAPAPASLSPNTRFHLVNPSTQTCAVASSDGLHLAAVSCASAGPPQWMLDSSDGPQPDAARLLNTASWACLTSVEPNPSVHACLAAQLQAADGSGRVLQPSSVTCDHTYATTMALDPQALLSTGVLVHTALTVTQAASDANCTTQVQQRLSAAPSLAASRRSHADFWDDYWNASWVDLGPDYSLLESFYYGMQGHIGMAARPQPGNFHPGLWGPWITTETPAWRGDYTLNYNMQASVYGVFSDNRPALAENFFPIVLNGVALGRWRASSTPRWGAGLWGVPPGLAVNDFDLMEQLDPKRKSVPAGYAGLNFPTHFGPWPETYFAGDWGQKNIASFCAKAFIDYIDYTQNTTFLATHYGFLREVGEFYASYASYDGTFYHVLHSCAMENCGAQGPATQGNITVSNDPPFDLAFVKQMMRALLRYSTELGVDAARRPQWQHLLDNLAPYPLTRDERGELVFAQATLGSTGNNTHAFPTASYHGNARYPIVFLNSMHPGEDLDLDADPALLAIARQTMRAVNKLNFWSPTNSIPMAWAPASRVVETAEELLANFTLAVNATMMPNFVPFLYKRPSSSYGCNVENAGATKAVNDLLVAEHGHASHGIPALRFLPGGWPAGAPVAFANIRTRGAFLVSARAVGLGGGRANISAPIAVQSLAGRPCTFVCPYDQGCAVQQVGGAAIDLIDLGVANKFRFQTQAGLTYHILQS